MTQNEDKSLQELFQGMTTQINPDRTDRAITYEDFKQVVDHTIQHSYKTGLAEGIRKAEELLQQALDKVTPI